MLLKSPHFKKVRKTGSYFLSTLRFYMLPLYLSSLSNLEIHNVVPRAEKENIMKNANHLR